MESAVAPVKARPSWFVRLIMTSFRILFLTLLFTALGMALGLTTGILVTAISGLFTHHVDMTNAYRHFAIPSAITVGSCTFLYNVVQSIRRAAKGN